ncbi:hypothetical protein [Micromonospora tulbaghiae]|uniref:hypothetical protein n=1 Tax=Micromonospora tulbaghiae TaxID=479978 RepID=UPI003411A173
MTIDIDAIRQQPVTTEPANNTFVVWYDPYREPYAVYFRSDANGEDECRWFNADQHHSGGTEPSEWDELCDELLGNDGPHLLVPSVEIDRLRAENADLDAARQRLLDRLHAATPDLVTAQQRADQAEDRATDLADKLHKAEQEIASHGKAVTAWANEVEQLKKQVAGSGKADGPWKAFIVHEGWAANDFSELDAEDEVDIVIVRDSAAPDDEGDMPGTYKSDDVAFEARDVFVDGDGGTPAATIYARAQVMAAALNRAEVA